jgi:hypothetical protein
MECEVFKNFKLEIQQKFIWGMGRGIYGIFRHKLLTKVKLRTRDFANPNQIVGEKMR